MAKDPSIESSRAITTTRFVDRQLPRPRQKPDTRRPQRDIEAACHELKAAAAAQHVELDTKLDTDLGVVVVSVRDGYGWRLLRRIPIDELLRGGGLRLLDRSL